MVDPGPLLATTYAAGDLTVRLRLARPSDALRVRGLLERHRPELATKAARFVFFDPRERMVLLATAPMEGSEQAVGLVELGGGGALVVAATAQLDRLLTDAAGSLAARAHRAA